MKLSRMAGGISLQNFWKNEKAALERIKAFPVPLQILAPQGGCRKTQALTE